MKFALTLAVVLVVLFAAPSALAQGTNFNGTWDLDQGASEFPQLRRGRGGGSRIGAGLTLVITQTDNVLTMEHQLERGNRILTYHLDGSESTNSGPRGEQTTTSQWDGASLVTDGTMDVSTPRGAFSLELFERHTLSRDGQTLTVETTRVTPRGDITTPLVYTKTL